jgi:hypothetical protein
MLRLCPVLNRIELEAKAGAPQQGEGPFTSCLNDVRPSIAMTVGWQFTGSAFTLEIRK